MSKVTYPPTRQVTKITAPRAPVTRTDLKGLKPKELMITDANPDTAPFTSSRQMVIRM